MAAMTPMDHAAPATLPQAPSSPAAANAAPVDITPEEMTRRLRDALTHVVGRNPDYAHGRDWYYALAYVLRGLVCERAIQTAQAQYDQDCRRVYYLSMEYLTGSNLDKVLVDLGVRNTVKESLRQSGHDLDTLERFEPEPALGNGGLGRLAACFLDSMATHGYPGYGYGIRYEFGMFNQGVEDGQQVEHPEHWLRYGNPWEFERPNVIFPVRFHGRVMCFVDEAGERVCKWVDADEVVAVAYDIPISGYHTETVSNLRLWSSRATRDFDLNTFNEGKYIESVMSKTVSETLSKVLYPNDKSLLGQELRLKQEYFFVSASLQDIVARHLKKHHSLDNLAEKVVIQLNDTHPSLGVAELMRLLVDQYAHGWDSAWEITRNTFAYTNHTLLPEALEMWPISMLEHVLPRHLEIIYEINHHFLTGVRHRFPGDAALLRRVSLVDDVARTIRMAHLALVGSQKVNGVAALHTDLMRSTVFADFYRLWPEKFVNETNGVTPRRWLVQANPGLSRLITNQIGHGWETELERLSALAPLADDSGFRAAFREVKRLSKERLATLLANRMDLTVDPTALFDVQIKRMHEYKRQLLNLLHVIHRYNRIRDGEVTEPRVVLFAGKAAPGYVMAKDIIRLINDVATTVNNDPKVGDQLKVTLIPNYNVSLAEVIIPGSDLSEQISTAGMEASGTGNMKLALNGALTIGTLDGANIEIRDAVGADNIFIFGLTASEVEEIRVAGYDPHSYYHGDAQLKRVIDMIHDGFFSPEEPHRYRGITHALLQGGDRYMVLADFAAYVARQQEVDQRFTDSEAWTRSAVLNVAHMGPFSSDRTIHGYARDIWGVTPVRPE